MPRGPEQGLPRPFGLCCDALTHQRQQILTINVAIFREWLLDRGQQRRHDVDVCYRRVDRLTCGNPRRPFDEHRHANTALKVSDLPAPIRRVYVSQPHVAGAPVIAGEYHDSIFGETFLFQCRHHPTHAAIQSAGHRSVNPQTMWLDITDRFVVGSRRLQRSVNAPVR